MSNQLDDLLGADSAETDDAVNTEPTPHAEAMEVVAEEASAVVVPDATGRPVGMCVHNRSLYVVLDDGRMYFSDMRFRGKRNEWHEVGNLPWLD